MPSSDTPLVTIAIPTYNRADSFLKGAIICALKQTYKDTEILMSNNSSTDDTDEVVKSFNDPRIRYIKQENNIGPNNNFNFCINEARGKYFLLVLYVARVASEFIKTCIISLNTHSNLF